MAAARLIIDASMDKRLATELTFRGRPAESLSALGLRHANDDDLLPALTERFAEEWWVLVTADDAMPADHGDLIAELGVTVATIDPTLPRRTRPMTSGTATSFTVGLT